MKKIIDDLYEIEKVKYQEAEYDNQKGKIKYLIKW
jgi:hypothetical protein